MCVLCILSEMYACNNQKTVKTRLNSKAIVYYTLAAEYGTTVVFSTSRFRLVFKVSS